MTLRDQLKLDEGLRLTPYQDTGGTWTLGYGHSMRNPIPLTAAEAIFDWDLYQAETQMMRTLPWTMQIGNPARYDALVNLTFNLGIGGLLSFRNMLAAARSGDWAAAAQELLNSQYAAQVGDRARRLATNLRDGQ
jgi:lysozyme